MKADTAERGETKNKKGRVGENDHHGSPNCYSSAVKVKTGDERVFTRFKEWKE